MPKFHAIQYECISGHTFRKYKRSPTLASGFRAVHLQATKSPECHLALFGQSLYKTAKSPFMVQCVNVCSALINVHVLKALQRYVKLKTKESCRKGFFCDPPLPLRCSARRLEHNRWQRSSHAKSRAVEVSEERIEKRKKIYLRFYSDVTMYLPVP